MKNGRDGPRVRRTCAGDRLPHDRGGNRKVEVRPTGTTTDLINSTVAFASQKKYTMLAVGLVPPAKPTIAALLKTDDNSPPQSGNINLRVIHASTAGPPNLDIFVVAPGTNITNATPNISALAYQQASDYLNVPAATYEVIMADPTDRTIRPVDRTYTLTAGQIRGLQRHLHWAGRHQHHRRQPRR